MVQVLGPRKVPIGYEVTLEREGSPLTKRRVVSLSPETLERLHAPCRVLGGDEGAVVSAEVDSAPVGGAEPDGSIGGGSVEEVEADADASGELAGGTPLTFLPRFRANKKTQHAFGVTFLPGGRPEREDNFANEGFRLHRWHGWSDIEEAGAEVRINVWLTEPSDLEGIELVFRDQELVPDGSRISLEEYERTFAARVAAYEAGREDRQRASDQRDARIHAEREQLCAREPDHWQCKKIGFRPPPPPKAERQPPAPPRSDGIEVTWIPGYWQFDSAGEGEYVWVSGTYKIAVTNHPEHEAPPPSAVDDGQEHEVAADMPPPPAPREETIPPPPAIEGAIWVAGHYRVEGNAWVWVPGAWQVPPQRGARRIMPRVEVRGGVRIYVPGGWVIGR